MNENSRKIQNIDAKQDQDVKPSPAQKKNKWVAFISPIHVGYDEQKDVADTALLYLESYLAETKTGWKAHITYKCRKGASNQDIEVMDDTGRAKV